MFQSFFIGGFECSTHRLRSGRRLDLIAATAHDKFLAADYARLREQGILTAREGVRWHLIEAAPHRYDFSSLIPMLRTARRARIQVIWDLLHYGWPDGLDVWGGAFVDRFARFARAAAEVILEETGGPIYLVPVNEISFMSWGGGEAGFMNPFCERRGFELKVLLVRAAITATVAVREVDPGARVCHVEPIIHIVADPDHPEEAPAAEAYRLAQFQAWDMIAGRLNPELGGRPEYLDVVGVNYYANNQWIHQDPSLPDSQRRERHSMLLPSSPLHRPVRDMLREVYERYRRPLFIAETGIEGDARPSWLRYMGREARAAAVSGVPLEGLCLYPIVNHPGWGDDRHCHNGLWDYADADGHRPLYEPLARELARQQWLWDALRQGLVVTEEAVDVEEIDEAACHADDAALQSRGRRRE